MEEVINAAEKEKRQAMIEFESFKRLTEEREMRNESDHALKVILVISSVPFRQFS